MDPQDDRDSRARGERQNVRSDQRWHDNESGPRWAGDKKDRKPTRPSSGNPTRTAPPAAPKTKDPKAAAPKPKAPRTKAPKPTAPPTTAPKPTAPKPTAPPTTAPKPSAPSTTAPVSGHVARVVALVNSERSKAGCSPVTVNARLSKAAQAHSEDMASHRNMSHTGSDGSSAGDRITRAGYNWSTYGENVAYGYSTPEQVMAGWMSSPGHKKNILNCGFKEIGVGLAQPDDYWTQNFGTAG
ncbi:CAP domain-containing protein [Streptomyces sp. NPDC005805]|uniref:CAP domain-containing protein n=1 Tax=Streptomyces sp. NPDC005805 TaxID=3157068 RepID=UPI0033CC6B4A